MVDIHACGVCHHDLKPENVIISDTGFKPWIVDFGMASRYDNKFRKAGKGTIQYVPPECFADEMCFASDIWSLGVMLYEIASHGLLPFIAKNEEELKREIIQGEPEPFRPRFNVPTYWQDIITKQMLCKDPKKRSTAQQILAQLAAVKVTKHEIAKQQQEFLGKLYNEEFEVKTKEQKQNKISTILQEGTKQEDSFAKTIIHNIKSNSFESTPRNDPVSDFLYKSMLK